jgi:serine/threonine protein phosphatase PrpC
MHNDQPSPVRCAGIESIRLLNDCRDKAIAHLMRALQDMLDKVDDTLFDLAEKSESDAAQSAYFDAMREVRLRRQRMEEEFRRRFLESYGRNAQTDLNAGTFDGSGQRTISDLMLVNNDDLEESLAITNMINKLEAAAKDDLFALDKRVGFLTGDTELARQENPLGPRVICDAARQACRQVESGIEVKLIILKLFDKLVVRMVPALYRAINDHLVQAGILPQIRPIVVRNESGLRGAESGFAGREKAREDVAKYTMPGSQEKGAGASVALAGAGLDIGGPDSCSSDLLATLRSVMAANALGQRSIPEGVQFERVHRALGDLTLVQRGHTELIGADGEHLDGGMLDDNTANVLRLVKTANIASGIGQVDDMMIDIVAMMFDYILDDKNLADSIKALIARLQIPILKVAILDKSFFSRKFHPARKLLNSMADAAMGWSEEHHRNDALFKTIEAIVHRILFEFEDDPSIFSKLFQEFERFLAEQERSSEVSSYESAKIAEAREKLQLARAIAQEEVTRRIGSQSVPGIIRSFLDTHWKGLLIASYVNGGDQADEWRHYIETMDDLLWSVTPKPTAEERFSLVGLLPGLVRRLNEGMAKASMDQKERDHFVAKLADYHAQAVKPVVEGKAVTAVRRIETASSPELPEELASGRLASTEGSLDSSCQILELPDGFSGEDLTVAMRLVQSAISKANSLIFRTAQRRPRCKGMGTTLVAALFADNRVTIAHVGDSRLYRLRNEELHQITVDHSLQQELVEKGFYTQEEARLSVNKSIVTRAIGVEPTVKADLMEEVVREGDIFLLCSDGLSDLVTEQEMWSILKRFDGDLEAAAELLVKSANNSGGKDNISVVLARTLGSSRTDQLLDAAKVGRRRMQIVSRSDVGRKRSHNEDSVRADSEIGVAVLADGMGGYNAGEVASAIAVNLVADELRKGLLAAQTSEDEGGMHGEERDELAENEQLNVRYLRELIDKGGVEVEEITIQDVENVPNVPEVADEHTDTARDLEIGSWVEFRRPGEASVRARLTWISSVTGAYLFTDRQGLKVADSTVDGLAVEFRRGTATLIDDVPLFDRAVSSLMERLKHSGRSLAG